MLCAPREQATWNKETQSPTRELLSSHSVQMSWHMFILRSSKVVNIAARLSIESVKRPIYLERLLPFILKDGKFR